MPGHENSSGTWVGSYVKIGTPVLVKCWGNSPGVVVAHDHAWNNEIKTKQTDGSVALSWFRANDLLHAATGRPFRVNDLTSIRNVLSREALEKLLADT